MDTITLLEIIDAYRGDARRPFFVALVLAIVLLGVVCVAENAQAATYTEMLRIDLPDRVLFFDGCDVLQRAPDRIGAYCTDELIIMGSAPSAASASAPAATVVIFSFDGTFDFIDETGDCVTVGGDRARCGDFVFVDRFGD